MPVDKSAMQLAVQLLNGSDDNTVVLDVAADELWCQVAKRAAKALQKRRLTLVTESAELLAPAATVGQVGLLDGARLTAVVVQDISTKELQLNLTGEEVQDLEAMRRLGSEVHDSYVVRVCGPLTNLGRLWDELPGTEGLVLRVNPGEQFDAAIWALSRQHTLRKLEFGLRGHRAHSFLVTGEDKQRRFMDALPACLEELALPGLSKAVAQGLSRLPNLRKVHCPLEGVSSLELLGSALCALPGQLEELVLCGRLPSVVENQDARPLAEGLGRLSDLRSFNMYIQDFLNSRHELIIHAVLRSLPAGLEDLSVQVKGDGNLDFKVLAANLLQLPALRSVTLEGYRMREDQWVEVLAALPRELESLCVKDLYQTYAERGVLSREVAKFRKIGTVSLQNNRVNRFSRC